MTVVYAILAIWAIVAIGFYIAIRREGARRGATPNVFQVIVAVFWFIWGIWYICSITKEKLRG